MFFLSKIGCQLGFFPVKFRSEGHFQLFFFLSKIGCQLFSFPVKFRFILERQFSLVCSVKNRLSLVFFSGQISHYSRKATLTCLFCQKLAVNCFFLSNFTLNSRKVFFPVKFRSEGDFYFLSKIGCPLFSSPARFRFIHGRRFCLFFQKSAVKCFSSCPI